MDRSQIDLSMHVIVQRLKIIGSVTSIIPWLYSGEGDHATELSILSPPRKWGCIASLYILYNQ